jgi:hypothetical protein
MESEGPLDPPVAPTLRLVNQHLVYDPAAYYSHASQSPKWQLPLRLPRNESKSRVPIVCYMPIPSLLI